MEDLSKSIEKKLNKIFSKIGNQNEFLLGDCKCKSNITNTQRHILMLLENNDITNKDISSKLNISQAAVTKAIKSLIKEGLIYSTKDENDGRVIRYKLSENAKNIAITHKEHHDRTLSKIDRILDKYSVSERNIIVDFLDSILMEVGE